jgi:hypothetical protein
MSGNAKAELQREVGPGLEDVLERLSDQDCATLLTLFQKARRTQMDALRASIDKVLRILPRPFRGTARKIMFG